VAAHVAGKVLYSNDKLHKAWVRRKLGDVRASTIPKLAEALTLPLHDELERLKASNVEQTPLSYAHESELLLHNFVKSALVRHFGVEGDRWWVDGVPLAVRQECAARREGDVARDEPYSYMYLIDLRSILEKNWALFMSNLQNVRQSVASKKEFFDQLISLNEIRNRYSHPIRAPGSASSQYAEDLQSASRIKDILVKFCQESGPSSSNQ
jgi:hypothetical protein